MTKERLRAYRSMRAEISELEERMTTSGMGMEKYGVEKKALEKECEEIEKFVEGIGDSLTRRIFRMHFLEGGTQKAVGIAVNVDKSVVSRRIDRLLKVATKTTNATL